jgi:hypothetical protein
MSDNINLINDEVPAYKKKSKKKGQPRADHKHVYETVLLIRRYYLNVGTPSISEEMLPTKVCTICGRIDCVDKDDALYEVHPDPTVKSWMVWRKALSKKALNLPKWRAEWLDKFATKVECDTSNTGEDI